MIDAEWGEVMDQTDSDADERAEKSTSLNDVYVYVSHKNGRFAGAMAGCSTMPPLLNYAATVCRVIASTTALATARPIGRGTPFPMPMRSALVVNAPCSFKFASMSGGIP